MLRNGGCFALFSPPSLGRTAVRSLRGRDRGWGEQPRLNAELSINLRDVSSGRIPLMRILFLFLDGVGLGRDDPAVNPLARAKMPNLRGLLGGKNLVADAVPFDGPRASLLGLDACLGVTGLPQSATGQAALLTGINVPLSIGYHYGPKPNRPVAEFLRNGSIFSILQDAGKRVGILNAYPPRYFEAIRSGRRMYSAIPLAATSAGVALPTADDLHAGRALSVDFTGHGWHTELGLTDTPLLEPAQAGEHLARLAEGLDLAFFEYWISDYAGHHQAMEAACALFETLDTVLGSLLAAWDDRHGLILITSDHGNLEDLSHRRHTANPVPALLVGASALRHQFTASLHSLTDIAPAIQRLLG
jgi:2,3-bisphosphoglycerate-independent phosphoglycerate mutase